MPDNIYHNPLTNQDAFYSVKKPAWHLKGYISDRYETSKEVIVKSGLNFTVEKLPNKHVYPSGKEIYSETSFHTFRTDLELTLGDNVGKDYTIIQNIDAFSFLDQIAGVNNIYYETAGALRNGEIIFITAKFPHHIKILGKDVIELYLFITTRHDGKGSIVVGLTPVRVVCNNTLNAALRNCETVVRVRHTESAPDKLKEAQKILKMVDTAAPIIDQAFNQLAKVRITDQQLRKLIQTAMAPNTEVLDNIKAGNYRAISPQFKTTVEEILSYGQGNVTQQLESTKGTLFGFYNAITGFYQNRKMFKNEEVKAKNILFGGAAQRTAQKAFDLCLDFAQYGESILLN
jgi:phage/plasmid-like protein (TIGR03299 family)